MKENEGPEITITNDVTNDDYETKVDLMVDDEEYHGIV